MSDAAGPAVNPRDLYSQLLGLFRRLFRQVCDVHERGFLRVASESTDRYHSELAAMQSAVDEVVPQIAHQIRGLWGSGLPAPLLADAETDLRLWEQAIANSARPMVHTPTLMGWNVDERGQPVSPSFALDPEHFAAHKVYRQSAAECQSKLSALDRWTGYLPLAADASLAAVPLSDAPRGEGRSNPPADCTLSFATLTERAAAAYARTKGRFLLIACPERNGVAGSSADETPGLPVQRVTEDDPNCWRFVGETVHLPFSSSHYLGCVTVKDAGRYYLVLGTPTGSGFQEVPGFVEFAKDAGAMLRASPPPQLTGGGGMSADQLWATVLMFRQPNADETVRRVGDCLMIAQPWAASLLALRAWCEDTSPQTQSATVGNRDEQVNDDGPAELTAVERALMIYSRDPNQSVRAVARQVGCNHTLLLRDPRFQRMREAHAGTLPRGRKSKDGNLEAEIG